MKADGSLKSLLQGVSQQPTRDRLPGQGTEQINMSSDPVKGLSRRPGDDLVGTLGLAEAIDWGRFKTENGQRFIAKIVNGGIEIYDSNAVQYPVNITGNMTYWNTPGKWSIVSIREKIYMSNTSIVTAMRAETAAYINQGTGSRTHAIFQVLGGNYGKVYRVTRNGNTIVEFTTADGSEGKHSLVVQTTYIAQVIEWLLTTAYDGNGTAGAPSWVKPGGDSYNGMYYKGTGEFSGSGYTVTRAQDVILIRSNNTAEAPFNLTVSDDAGNINFKVMVNSVPDIADLPRYAPQDYVIRVAEETNPEEDLWLKFVTDAGYSAGNGFGTAGAWYETVAPNVQLGFNKGTMPRIMAFDGTTFTIGEGDWEDRTVGTETTNPTPSFIGYPINDMANFQSRLVFISQPSVVASRTKKYTNFWIGSASSLVDTDPIDLSSQAAQATILRYAIPHNKDLVIFSDEGQFVLFGRTAATPSNASLVLTTSFETDLSAKPSACGRNVFFATKYGQYTGVREFYTEGGTDINDTRPITQHVKEYLLGQVSLLSSTSNYDTLIIHTDRDKATIYPYQFIWSDNTKVQSAWSKWIFDDSAHYSFFEQEQLFIVTSNTEGFFLRRLSLDVLEEPDIDYHVHLSAKFDVFNVNTAFVLPFDWLSGKELRVIQGTDCPYIGLPVAIQSIEYSAVENGYVVTLREDMKGGNIVVGIKFRSEYEPTMPRVKDGSGDVVSSARLQINQFIIALEDTGSISGYKKTKWGNGPVVDFEGYVVNNVDSLVGKAAITDRTFRLPFKERADRGSIVLFADDHWPMTILDIEWAGTVNKRGRRIETRDSQ